MLHSEKNVCSMFNKYAKKVDSQKSLLNWHFTVLTCLEWNCGGEPVSLNFQTVADFVIMESRRCSSMNGAVKNSQLDCRGLE